VDRPITGPEPIREASVATILIIDDSDAHRAQIRAAVDASGLFGRVLEATDGLRGLKLLLGEPVDVVLCDLEMPGLDGEKLLWARNQRSDNADVPFLFLTASADVKRKARLLEGGACDAIAKPFHPADLVARLRLHLKVKRLQDELMVKNATLARLSTIDALTGLRTRRYVTELLSIEFLRARRYSTPLALFMADLDNFKAVNDEYGHPGGDVVLRAVSEQLLSTMRSTDVAGRFGGEELLAVLPQNTAEGAAVVAERWRAEVENTAFVAPDGRLISTTISIGIADYRESFESPDDLIAASDKVLYVAKQKGRNRIEVYRESSDTP
jgi:diguanylate cyclase (GGDEF)-like protein